MPIEPFTSRISYVSGDLVKGRRIKLAFHWTCIGGSQYRIHELIQHTLKEIRDWEPPMQVQWKATLINKRGCAPIHQNGWIMGQFIRWMGSFYAHSVKSHPYAHSVKSHSYAHRLFDEKALRWKGTPPSLGTRGGDWIRTLNLRMLTQLANLTEDSLMEHTAHRYLREVYCSIH
jgi:hypothetical protein